MSWNIKEKKSILKSVKKLPVEILTIYGEAKDDLANEGPVPVGWDVCKINDNEYRLKLNYRYRIRYMVDITIKIIGITYLGHRKDAYR